MKIYNDMVKGFLRAEGRRIINEEGETVILRGWGMGNWMNPEGFMIGGTTPQGSGYAQPKKLDRARSLDQLLRELCGTEYAESFWPRWYRAYLKEKDIRAMAELGYNAVRLVLESSAFLKEEPGICWNEDTFSMLDDVLDWCEKYRIYAILDMHAAPGGQSCGACDNGVDNVPHLFIDEESRDRAILLWEEFARRYGGRWIVGGYDLLNEPLNDPAGASMYGDKLKEFYDTLIPRIRAIDKNHLLTLESTIWATQPALFDHNYDPECNNWCIHMHNYRYIPEMQENSAILERSLELNVPLWMGEGGSDQVSNAIFLQMLEKENIGYALWSWKSCPGPFDGVMPDEPAPAEHALPKDWELVFNYADHGGPRPGYEKSQRIFDEYLELVDYDRCVHNRTRHLYTLRQPGITLPAVGYDHGEPGVDFDGKWYYGNAFQYREADRMKMIVKPGGLRPGPKTLWFFAGYGVSNTPRAVDSLWLVLRPEEFVHYTIHDVKESCKVTLSMRCDEPSEIEVGCGTDVRQIRLMPSGEISSVEVLTLSAGDEQQVCVKALEGEVQIESVAFE